MENIEGGFEQEAIDEMADTLRGELDVVKELARKFPPLCRVTAEGYAIPRKGSIGRVVSWFEGGDSVGVIHENSSDSFLFGGFRGECEVSRLTVVGYTLPFTPEWVEGVIGKGK